MFEIIYHLKGPDARPACSKMFLSAGEYLTESKKGVTCLPCKLTATYLALPPAETAGRPAVTDLVHFTTPALLGFSLAACGLSHSVHQVSSRAEEVTCADCRQSPPFLTRYGSTTAGRPAVTTDLVHRRRDTGLTALCEAEGQRIYGGFVSEDWKVTCPDCINIMSREAENIMTEIPIDKEPEAGEEEGFYVPSQDDLYTKYRHDWNMVTGPVHKHDCDVCLYLGTVPVDGDYVDLYFCDQGGERDTVIARHGEHGNYHSGIDFIDRIPGLALAYVRALYAGILRGVRR